ncbi:hypothetical protein DSM110093_01986 [Sulfitobacter sp. DSM 110093]|uniref:hypothetical protein n=1 Tax=Sulfitobacter sp. DSM 110093 TaxID=2883127 RepID=UPI001FADA6D6|nr:hypothetical protein [Sulfitobacter sp. DSM 110093]UOA32201.1 hypothetical protein DSM110093_01986 [Sulfitobacter sp. DSM 110093]
MTVDLIKQFEDVPENYPAAPSGLSIRAAALDANMIWARIEAYTAWRFTDREVIWTLIGDGGDQFNPRLTPVVSHMAEQWLNENWRPLTLLDGPLGIILPSDGTYKIVAQVGGGDVPAAVSEAFRRLAEYLGGARNSTNEPGASSVRTSIGDDLDFEVERNPNWVARAMQQSGAGDLLRPYRRV